MDSTLLTSSIHLEASALAFDCNPVGSPMYNLRRCTLVPPSPEGGTPVHADEPIQEIGRGTAACWRA